MNNFSNIQFFFVLISELNSCLFMKNAGTCFRIRKKKNMKKWRSMRA